MDIYERRLRALQQLVKTRFGGNQTALSLETGVSTSYLSRMLKEEGEPNRKRIGEDMALRLEEALRLPPGSLVVPEAHHIRSTGGSAPEDVVMLSPNEHRLLHAGERRHRNTARAPGGLSLAVLDIEGSMGLGRGVVEHETVVANMVVDEGWLRRNANFTSPENLALVTGKGDSMRPTFEDGDALLVDRGITEIKVDSIYVLSLRDELYIKRLQRVPDGSVLMISDNRAYEPYQISNAERDKFRVLGRVVMAWNARKV